MKKNLVKARLVNGKSVGVPRLDPVRVLVHDDHLNVGALLSDHTAGGSPHVARAQAADRPHRWSHNKAPDSKAVLVVMSRRGIHADLFKDNLLIHVFQERLKTPDKTVHSVDRRGDMWQRL